MQAFMPPKFGGCHAPPRYPSDLSDDEWAILEPLLSSAEKAWPSTEWAAEACSACGLLPAEERMRLADAA